MHRVLIAVGLLSILGTLRAQDTIPPGPVSNIAHAFDQNVLFLSWENPDDPDYEATLVRYRNDWTYSREPGEGTLLLDQPVQACTLEVDSGIPYVFALFTHDTAENFSEPAFLPVYISVTEHESLRVLFIHHSCGSNWLATGNGNLRDSLEAQGYSVHDATYGDDIGELTDVCHWYPKFRDQMDLVLTFDYHPNHYYEHGEQNDIIMFKSCYPASNIEADGTPPGDPEDCTKTPWNYYAAYNACAGIFNGYADKLFIPVTAPPLLAFSTTPENAERARSFNNWLKSDWEEAYIDSNSLYNVAVFDFFDLLTKHGYSNYEEYPSGGGYDNHPSPEGNQLATREFIPFLNWAVDRWHLGASPYIPGDADGNGTLDAADILYLTDYLFFGGPAPVPLASGDANGDETVTAADIVSLAASLFGGGRGR